MVNIHSHKRTSLCLDMCIDMRIDIWYGDLYKRYIYIAMCLDMYIDMCIDMNIDMCTRVYRHAHRHA